MYNCGPTVYDVQHIGNLRPYVFADVLRRTLEYSGHTVLQVINITDVGHLTGDNEGNADAGEDKMSKALRREGLPFTIENMQQIGQRYESRFFEDLRALNVQQPTYRPRASEHIAGMIALIETLEQKGYTYQINDGIYFDTSRYPEYGKLGGIGGTESHARVDHSSEKRQAADFALWKFNNELGWQSPWGTGFPGWHIECSAMAMHYLGKTIDVHTGGTDHISIHHNNEIAQSEAATGKPFARYWMHNAFITIDDSKIAKSVGNTMSLESLTEQHYSPLAYRYWLLTGHYRTLMNFTWDALDAAQSALERIHRVVLEVPADTIGQPKKHYRSRFESAIFDDLDTPKAIATLWELIRDDTVPAHDKQATLLEFDRVLGIGLSESVKHGESTVATGPQPIPLDELPEQIQSLVKQRHEAREQRNFETADRLRDNLHEAGYAVKDTPDGTQVIPVDASN
jgi:cysteinyl-tRNA synthetase